MNTSLRVLITGATKGIGREIAGQLAEQGHTVLVGARNMEQGEAVAAEIRADGGRALALRIDVRDPESVAAATARVDAEHGSLDALVNNAGISHQAGADPSGQLPRSADVEQIQFVMETNVLGVIRVSTAFLPLLRRSATPRIVNVSSSAGSLAAVSRLDSTDPIALGYVTSKTALTAVTMMYARDLAAEGILVNAVCPGFVATDLNGHRGVLTPAQGARQAVRMTTIPADGPTATFTDVDGPVPW